MIKFVSRLNLTGARVDREAGIIKGVSLISLGDAKGHDKLCDQKTLETVRDCAKQYGDLKVKFNPSTFTHGPAMLAGYLPADSIRIQKGKTIGDLHLYKAFPTEAKEYLYEIAEETPGNIGLSIEFTGDDEEIKGQKFARCQEIYAATIVDLPAANPTGLFSEGETKSKEQKAEIMDEETIKKLSAVLVPATVLALKPVIKQMLEEAAPAKSKADEEKEEMAAAGVTDEDDDDTKKKKVEEYRKSMAAMPDKKISEMTGKEFAGVMARSHMQFFRTVGGKPARVSEGDGEANKGDPFEKLVTQQMEAGAGNRGVAIARARRDHPKEYNQWMAKKHPNTQQMVAKK